MPHWAPDGFAPAPQRTQWVRRAPSVRRGRSGCFGWPGGPCGRAGRGGSPAAADHAGRVARQPAATRRLRSVEVRVRVWASTPGRFGRVVQRRPGMPGARRRRTSGGSAGRRLWPISRNVRRRGPAANAAWRPCRRCLPSAESRLNNAASLAANPQAGRRCRRCRLRRLRLWQWPGASPCPGTSGPGRSAARRPR